MLIECFHSRGQRLCKFIGTKEIVCIIKEFKSDWTGLGHQHGRCFIVLGHQNVMWKHSICHRNAINSEFRDLILDRIICNTFDKISCSYLRIRTRWDFVMSIIKSMNLISLQSWAYLYMSVVAWLRVLPTGSKSARRIVKEVRLTADKFVSAQ